MATLVHRAIERGGRGAAIVRMDSGQQFLGSLRRFGRVEAEHPVKARVAGGLVGRRIPMPGAHFRRRQREPQPLIGFGAGQFGVLAGANVFLEGDDP